LFRRIQATFSSQNTRRNNFFFAKKTFFLHQTLKARLVKIKAPQDPGKVLTFNSEDSSDQPSSFRRRKIPANFSHVARLILAGVAGVASAPAGPSATSISQAASVSLVWLPFGGEEEKASFVARRETGATISQRPFVPSRWLHLFSSQSVPFSLSLFTLADFYANNVAGAGPPSHSVAPRLLSQPVDRGCAGRHVFPPDSPD